MLRHLKILVGLETPLAHVPVNQKTKKISKIWSQKKYKPESRLKKLK